MTHETSRIALLIHVTGEKIRTCVHWKRDKTRPATNLWQLVEKMKLKIGAKGRVGSDWNLGPDI